MNFRNQGVDAERATMQGRFALPAMSEPSKEKGRTRRPVGIVFATCVAIRTARCPSRPKTCVAAVCGAKRLRGPSQPVPHMERLLWHTENVMETTRGTSVRTARIGLRVSTRNRSQSLRPESSATNALPNRRMVIASAKAVQPFPQMWGGLFAQAAHSKSCCPVSRGSARG